MSLADDFAAIPIGQQETALPQIVVTGKKSLADEFDAIQAPAAVKASAVPLPNAAPLSFMDRFGQGLRDPLDAGAQALAHAMPKGISDSINGFADTIGNLPGIGGALKAAGLLTSNRQGTKSAWHYITRLYWHLYCARLPESIARTIKWRASPD